MTEAPQSEHLLTRYVFIDTESMRKARFDWTGKTFSRLVEFAKQGRLRLLTTEVTKGEVLSQLRELFAEAATSTRKNESILKQLGANSAVDAFGNAEAALATLDAAFENFLRDVKAIDIPLNVDLSAILNDYFSRRPPFSTKKKAEFPDAFVAASLLAWCNEKNTTAYVVSGDPDMKSCCSPGGPLLHAESIADIISQATVSNEFHAALENALSESEALSDKLADQIIEMDVLGGQWNAYELDSEAWIDGKIERVDGISFITLNVVEQNGELFTCELELEVELALSLDVDFAANSDISWSRHPVPGSMVSHITVYRIFYADLVVRFDRSAPNKVGLESVDVHLTNVELTSREVEAAISKY